MSSAFRLDASMSSRNNLSQNGSIIVNCILQNCHPKNACKHYNVCKTFEKFLKRYRIFLKIALFQESGEIIMLSERIKYFLVPHSSCNINFILSKLGSG
jgi:hypothetical protein